MTRKKWEAVGAFVLDRKTGRVRQSRIKHDDDALIDFLDEEEKKYGLVHLKLTNSHFFLFHSTEPTGAANSKSAAIEMYAPSSYNDTVTGETLSSVSDKSDSYSNDGSQPDLTVNKFFSLLLGMRLNGSSWRGLCGC